MNLRRKLVMVLTVCWLVVPVRGQARNFYFDHLTIADGLSQNSVTSILQDREGYLWFGTEDGLNRFDGYEFKIFTHQSAVSGSITDNRVKVVFEDSQGILWVGTARGGLNQYRRHRRDFRFFRPGNAESEGGAVQAIAEDDAGNLWIGTMRRGIYRFDRVTGVFSHFLVDPQDPDAPRNWINRLEMCGKGSLWVGTQDGLFRFNVVTGVFDSIEIASVTQASGFEKWINALCRDRSGNWWVGTYQGLYRLDKEGKRLIPFDPSGLDKLMNTRIYALHEDRAHRLWVGTWDGLFVFHPDKSGYEHYPGVGQKTRDLDSSFVLDIYEDTEGIIWVGTASGINKINPHRLFFENYQVSDWIGTVDRGCPVLCLYQEDDGIIWLGTYGEGLFRFDQKQNRLANYRSDGKTDGCPACIDIVDLYKDSRDRLWVGTISGDFFIFDFSSETFRLVVKGAPEGNSPRGTLTLSVFEQSDGSLWLASGQSGVMVLDRDLRRIRHYTHDPENPRSLSDNAVISMLEDRRGQIWLATYGGGLNRFQPERGVFHHYRYKEGNPKTIGSDFLYQLHEDPEGIIWIGSNNGGLVRFDPERITARNYTRKDGLPSNTVTAVMEDNRGNLWLSTYKGISHFDRGHNTFRNFSVGDGLRINEFTPNSAFKTDSGEILMGGFGGFVRFDPRGFQTNTFLPPVVITSLKVVIDGSIKELPVDAKEKLELSWNHRPIFIDFAALSYANPVRNGYAYMLKGHDRYWNHIGTRHTISFTDLRPGNYTLRVRGSNNDGVWNENGVSLDFRILPPFWGTWWFRGLVGILLLGLITVAYRQRVRRIELKYRSQIKRKTLYMKKGISSREEEIINLLLKEMTNREIEEALYISSHTVKNHIYNIYRKLQVSNRTELKYMLRGRGPRR